MIGDPFSSEYWKSHFCRDSGHHISLLANLLRKEDKKKYKSAFQASYFIINEKERRRASRLYPTGGWRISRLLSVYCPKNVFPCGTSETRKKRLAAFRDKEKIEIAAFFKFINESVSGKDIKYYGDWRLEIWNEFSKELEAKVNEHIKIPSRVESAQLILFSMGAALKTIGKSLSPFLNRQENQDPS